MEGGNIFGNVWQLILQVRFLNPTNSTDEMYYETACKVYLYSFVAY